VKSLKIFVTLAVLAAACSSGSADAGRVRVFVGVGAPFFYPFAPLPYYSYPPVVAVPAAPVNYVEQGQPSAGRASTAAPGITARRPRPITPT
jgi:hypothetical protein